MVVRKRSSAATNSEYQDKDNMDKDNIDKNNIEKDNMDKDKFMHAFHNLLQTDLNMLGRLEIVLRPASLSERDSVLWWLTGPVSAYTELHPSGQQFNSAGLKTIPLSSS